MPYVVHVILIINSIKMQEITQIVIVCFVINQENSHTAHLRKG